jgi:hypothetical protein
MTWAVCAAFLVLGLLNLFALVDTTFLLFGGGIMEKQSGPRFGRRLL